METTFNYKLKKPNQEEFYNIDVHNSNMDSIDETLITLETKTEHQKTKDRVSSLEANRAMKNGSIQENFDTKELNAEEIKIKGATVYHTGRKPSKEDVGLGNVDNYPSSDKYESLDESGNKFILQKAVKAFYDKFTSLTTRVTSVEENRAMKNGSAQENFNIKELNAEEIKINGNLVYNTGRRPSKEEVGLGNLLNLTSSDKYNILDETGDKFVLQKAIKNMYDDLKQEIYDSALLGEPVQTLCNDLPNETNYGWCDGGQLKKSDYPNLWARVENTINLASQKITSGELSYGVNYFGWYIGDSSEYFRKPNLNMPGYFLRPSGSRFTGHYEEDSFKLHNHSASSVAAGNHGHSGSTSQHSHSHSFGFVMAKTKEHQRPYFDGVAPGTTYTTTDHHTHTLIISANGNHAHQINIGNNGSTETKPKNIAVKFYCRLK